MTVYSGRTAAVVAGLTADDAESTPAALYTPAWWPGAEGAAAKVATATAPPPTEASVVTPTWSGAPAAPIPAAPPVPDGLAEPTSLAPPVWAPDWSSPPAAQASPRPLPMPAPTPVPVPVPVRAEPVTEVPSIAAPVVLDLWDDGLAADDGSVADDGFASESDVATDPGGTFGWDSDTSAPENTWIYGKQLPPWWKRKSVLLGASVVALAGAAAYIFLGNEPPPKAVPPPPPPPPPATATAIAPEQLAANQPQQTFIVPSGGLVQVGWKAPEAGETAVVGYMVVAQTPEGKLLEPAKLVGTAEKVAVFSGASAAPGSCYVVTTVISGQPSVALATGRPVCLPGTRPAGGDPSAESSPAPSQDDEQAPAEGAPVAPADPDE
ncbi:hypothetical protein OG216_16690 [Streptomycetaceae bacterium NBC_01309]